MKIIFYLLPFLFWSGHTRAQTNEIDSLVQLLKTSREDTNKVKILSDLAGRNRWNDPRKAITYGLEGLQLSVKLHYKTGEQHCYILVGEALGVSGNYAKSMEMKLKGLKLAEELKDDQRIGWALLNIASGYFYQGDYNQTILYTRKAMVYSETSKSHQKLIYGFLGEAFCELNQLDSALFYIQHCYELDITDKWHWPVPYYYLGNIHEKLDHLGLALEYFRAGTAIDAATKDNIDGYIGLARVFQRMDKKDSALVYARKAILEGQQYSFPSEVLKAATIVKNIYRKEGRLDSAFFYEDMMMAAKDSLFSQEKMKAVQDLTFEEQLRQVEITQKKINEEKKRKLNLQYAAIAIGLISFLVLFLALSRSIIGNEKLIRFFGVLGLLALFEFINLFLHPYLATWTHESPSIMLLILVVIGALLIPIHHKVEKWLIKLMVEKNKKIRLAAAKRTIASLEPGSTNS